MIFSELYSAYYRTVAEIIKAAIDHPLQKEEMRNIIQHYAFEESVLNIEPALTEERWQLLQPDGTTIIHKQPSMPLTMIQKQWLKAISMDERIRLFLDEPLDFGDVAPLFTPDDFYIFDKYADGDNYSDENYIRNFRMILDAIKNGQPLKVEMYNHKGKPIQMILLPKYLEYSEKDDKFRVVGYGQKLGERLILAGSYVVSIMQMKKASGLPSVFQKESAVSYLN